MNNSIFFSLLDFHPFFFTVSLFFLSPLFSFLSWSLFHQFYFLFFFIASKFYYIYIFHFFLYRCLILGCLWNIFLFHIGVVGKDRRVIWCATVHMEAYDGKLRLSLDVPTTVTAYNIFYRVCLRKFYDDLPSTCSCHKWYMDFSLHSPKTKM